MKHKLFGIYSKVFFYTLAIIMFVICVTVIFFANQISSVVEKAQQEQLGSIFLPLSEELKGKTAEESLEIAANFHTKNSSFEFSLCTENGEAIYKTDNYEQLMSNEDTLNANRVILKNSDTFIEKGIYKFALNSIKLEGSLQLVMMLDGGSRLYIVGRLSSTDIYIEYIEKTAVALILILLVSIVGAALFAHRIAGPIKKIADDTRSMAQLMPVLPPKIRKDEIGTLAADVYSMYEALKSSISQLETEIAREREMEENQRYFFSAASHDLKTPIAAMSALIEEMIEGYSLDNLESLRKCMKMLGAQKKLVSEILNIVRLSGDDFVINKQDVYLRRLVDSLLPLITPLSESKDIEVSVHIPDDLVCRTDKTMLERVFTNIFMNAVQNTLDRGSVRIWAENDNNDIRFYVSNTGEQIDKDMIPKLFEPFFRLDKARRQGCGHNGLGLTIVKRTLDRLDIPFSLFNTEDGVGFFIRFAKI